MAELLQAMVLEAPGTPLVLRERPLPQPAANEILIRVNACGVCRTDLHLLDGELPEAAYPLVPGHQVVGHIQSLGAAVTGFQPGQRVGLGWLGSTCGECFYCRSGLENLCDVARFTGCHRDGGFATHCLARAAYCYPLSEAYGDAAAAPLLCAGLIGYRCLRHCGEARRLGFYGFGAAAHLITQLAVWQGREVLAFTRAGDTQAQQLARSLGAAWAGAAEDLPEPPLDAAIIFAPAGELVPLALRAVRKGGRVVCGGIHMSDIPGIPYRDLWGERSLCSVANLTRADARAFLELAPQVPVRATVRSYPLAEANTALADLRAGAVSGAAVLVMP